MVAEQVQKVVQMDVYYSKCHCLLLNGHAQCLTAVFHHSGDGKNMIIFTNVKLMGQYQSTQ